MKKNKLENSQHLGKSFDQARDHLTKCLKKSDICRTIPDLEGKTLNFTAHVLLS